MCPLVLKIRRFSWWWAGIIAAPLSGLVRVIILIILANIRAGFICLRVLNLSVVIIPTHYHFLYHWPENAPLNFDNSGHLIIKMTQCAIGFFVALHGVTPLFRKHLNDIWRDGLYGIIITEEQIYRLLLDIEFGVINWLEKLITEQLAVICGRADASGK